jgi:hypothetical protein
VSAFVTHGTAYHLDEACPGMVHGELLWDSDSDENWWIAGSFRREVSGPEYAAACGKWPCQRCVPTEQRVFPPLHGQTFGHQPVTETGYYGPEVVCARCNMARLPMLSAPWPCTSAVVLGLAPRTEAEVAS